MKLHLNIPVHVNFVIKHKIKYIISSLFCVKICIIK